MRQNEQAMTISPFSFFISAVGLAFILEGSLYFLIPTTMKNLLEQIKELPASYLRNMGLVAMVLGLILVYIGMGNR